jgi:hypothetical protein
VAPRASRCRSRPPIDAIVAPAPIDRSTAMYTDRDGSAADQPLINH